MVVGDDVDVDAAVGLEPDGDHHDQEVKDGVLAIAHNLPIGSNQSYNIKWRR